MTGAWLFARDGKSFWIECRDEANLEVRLDLDGPEGLRRSFTFTTERELQDFLTGVEERLLETGWTFQRYESGDAGVSRNRRA
jgi:hypothetical protein